MNRVASLAALLLDLYTHRASTRLGAYNVMGDVKLPLGGGKKDRSSPRLSPAPQPELPRNSVDRPYRAGPGLWKQTHFAYEAPSEQTRYDGPTNGDLGERL